MSGTWLLLNLAYFIYAVSGTFKDMLRLRLVLLVASGVFMAYGAAAGVWSVFWWNFPVGAVQAYRIWQLVQDRRNIDLDEEAEAIRTLLFSDLDRVAFNAFWHLGNERLIEDDVLITRNLPVNELTLILDGAVDVELDGDTVVRLTKLRMLGEMSHVSGATASATVRAVGSVRVREWDKQQLAQLGKKYPMVERSLLWAIGHELARKLR